MNPYEIIDFCLNFQIFHKTTKNWNKHFIELLSKTLKENMMDLNLNLKAKFIEKFVDQKHVKDGFRVTLNGNVVEFRSMLNFEKDPVKQYSSENDEKVNEKGFWEHNKRHLYKQGLIKLPFDKCIKIVKKEKDLLEEIGIDNKHDFLYEIVDEFDSSFEKLAIASLNYHIHHSVSVCPPSTQEKYENLIERLSAHSPRFTDEESKHLSNCRAQRRKKKYDSKDNDFLKDLMTPTRCETCQNIYQKLDERQLEFKNNKAQTRHDFVDIMPSLWS